MVGFEPSKYPFILFPSRLFFKKLTIFWSLVVLESNLNLNLLLRQDKNLLFVDTF